MFLSLHATHERSAQGIVRSWHTATTATNDEYRVNDITRNVRIRLKKRSSYPGTFCQTQADGSLLLGYGALHPLQDDEFLHITVRTNGDIQVQRDLFCTLPLFYAYDGHQFVLSNDYAEVCKNIDLHLSHKGLMHALSPVLEQPLTLWREVRILGERERLSWQAGQLSLIPPQPRSWTYSDELQPSDPREYPALIKERFSAFIRTRLTHETVGFEISGGLDSSLLPLYMVSEQLYQPSIGATIVLSEEYQDIQLPRIEALEAFTSLNSHRIMLNPDTHHPLKNVLSRKQPVIPPLMELYEPAVVEIADYFQGQGVSVVVGGVNGDDVMQHLVRSPSNRAEMKATTTAPFYTEKVTPPQFWRLNNATLLPRNTVGYNVSYNNIFIERGMWIVSPFCDLVLFNYCQALPIQFRANKNIVRAYYEACHFPECLYKGEGDSFEPVFNRALLSDQYSRLIHSVARQSYLAQLGYIDPEALLQTYAGMHPDACDGHTLFQIYMWLCAELNIQHTLKKSHNLAPV